MSQALLKHFLEEVCPDKEDGLAILKMLRYCVAHPHRIQAFVVLNRIENEKSKFCGACCDDAQEYVASSELYHRYECKCGAKLLVPKVVKK